MIEPNSVQKQVRAFLRMRWVPSVGWLLFFGILHGQTVWASVKQEVSISGHVQSFGGYTVTESFTFDVTSPGEVEIGRVVVDGLYNGPYPWIMRVYTDNLHFAGIAGALRKPSPAGLVSEDGAYAVALLIHSPNFGPNEWRKIPDLSDPGYQPYQPESEPGRSMHSDLVIMGIDPRNADWVAGDDGLLYTEDDNLLGDVTIATPFELILKGDFTSASVRGNYKTTLYVEIVSAP